jgi:hypothetical protein
MDEQGKHTTEAPNQGYVGMSHLRKQMSRVGVAAGFLLAQE